MKTILFILSLFTLTSVLPAASIDIDTRKYIAPAVEYFGWDTKGGAEIASTRAAAEKHFGTGSNLIRIPIYLNAAARDGKIDASKYEKHVTCVHNARAINPLVKVFASLKLEGANTFPKWMEDKQMGRIFSHSVHKPNPELYGKSVVDYIQFMRQNQIGLDYLGINNEVEGALPPDLYIKAAETIRRECAARHIPREYTSFQFVGAECFSLPASVNYARNLKRYPGFVQILGSHCYYGHKGDHPDEWNKLGTVMNVPMWHTEVHMAKGAAIAETLHSLGIVFAAGNRGVSGFIWWGAGGGNTIGQTIKRELTRTMIGGRMVQTSPSFLTQGQEKGAVAQAIRNGHRLTLWIASRADMDGSMDVRFTGDAVKQIVSGTYWCGTEEEITPANSGPLGAKIGADGSNLTVANPPANSIAMLILDLY